MELSQSKRAISARLWRVSRREKRRLSVFVNDYVRIKYGNIYNECNQFYQTLSEKYPGKADLTKSKEFKKWKKEATEEEFHKNFAVTESISDITETIKSPGEPTAATAESFREPTAATAESFREPTSVTVDPVENITESITVATPAEQDILQIAAQDLIPSSPVIVNNIDNIIDNIIRDLEQDEDLRNIMDNDELAQPHYMDEDEGIGLNVESELEAIMEPFDFELEVEGAEW